MQKPISKDLTEAMRGYALLVSHRRLKRTDRRDMKVNLIDP